MDHFKLLMLPVRAQPRRCCVKSDTAHFDAYFGVGFVGTEYPAERFADFQTYNSNWGPKSVYIGNQTKVVMYGEFRMGEKAESRDGWVCKFGCEDVKIQINGLYISFTPPACDHPRVVSFCIVDEHRKIRSNFYKFEYLSPVPLSGMPSPPLSQLPPLSFSAVMNKPAKNNAVNLDSDIVKEDLDPVEDFHILDWSPKSCRVGDQIKVVVYGEFKSGKARNGLYCKFAGKVVSTEIHEDGLSFTTPGWWTAGHDGFCIIDDKGRVRSNICVFERKEYRREKLKEHERKKLRVV